MTTYGFWLSLANSILFFGILAPRVQAAQFFYGSRYSVGNGSVRSWLEVDENNNPLNLGVSFSQAVLENLPSEHEEYEYALTLPQKAMSTGFTHVTVDWNPHGHLGGVYAVPHFDFHFYTITPQERETIRPTTEDPEKMLKLPSSEFMPTDYKPLLQTGKPRMGLHWVDVNAPELHGEPFTQTFLYGSYNGSVAFWEPMITNDFLKSQPDFTQTLKLPFAYEKSAYYPTQYSIKYDAVSQDYTVSLNQFAFRSATSVPEKTFIVSLFGVGALALGRKFKRHQKTET